MSHCSLPAALLAAQGQAATNWEEYPRRSLTGLLHAILNPRKNLEKRDSQRRELWRFQGKVTMRLSLGDQSGPGAELSSLPRTLVEMVFTQLVCHSLTYYRS